MAGPFFPPAPLAKFERPSAVTYNSNEEGSEEGEIRTEVADRQEGSHSPNPLNLNPSPVDQGQGVQRAQPPAQPAQKTPFSSDFDFPVEKLIANGILNDIGDLDVGARLVDRLFGLNPVPEVQDSVIPIDEVKSESDAGLSEGLAKYEEAKYLDDPTNKPCELPKIETGEQVKEESLQPEDSPVSVNYVEDGVEYQEAVVSQPAQIKTKPNEGSEYSNTKLCSVDISANPVPGKRQNRNKAPRQNSAAARNDPDNYTHPMPGQMHWSIDNLPNILYQLWPDKNQKRGRRPAATKPSPYPGEAVLTVFDILPDRISSNVEEFRLEAWQRLDPRIELADLVARMHPRCRPKTNALQQRTVRFRKVFKMVSWGSGNKRTPHLERAILDDMEANGIDCNVNSTRGLTPGFVDPSRGEAGGRVPVPSQYKDKRDNTPPPPRSYIDAGLWVPTTVIQAWRNRLSPYEVAVAIQYQAASSVAPMTTLPEIPAPPYPNPNRGLLPGPRTAYSSSAADTHSTGEKQEDKGGETKKADETEKSEEVQENKDHKEAEDEGEAGDDTDSSDTESYTPTEGEESSDSSSEESQSSQTSQATQDTEAEEALWAEFLNFSSDDEDCEDIQVAEPIYRARSNEVFNNDDVYSAFHTLEYWDRVYSQEPFGNFGHQATVVPNSPPAIPPRPAVPQTSQPAMSAPTMHWQGSRAQNGVQMHHYDQVQNYYHGWADHMGGDRDPTRRAYHNYAGLYVYERARQSLRYDPNLDMNAGYNREYGYEEPRIAGTGYTRTFASTRPPAITASTSQPKRKRDDDDAAGIGAQASTSDSGFDPKRRCREDDGSGMPVEY